LWAAAIFQADLISAKNIANGAPEIFVTHLTQYNDAMHDDREAASSQLSEGRLRELLSFNRSLKNRSLQKGLIHGK
jgi:hypothetical protein